ncbi:hypothetical protein JOD55_001025 [Arcanobacterium pluranimalium]|uniref:hypothetical protein n=1 Tax=Arcanobacterium pluranimalium TaxID=108028 RepID=UPI00195ACB42|nr:hypothetical protein [Arcanobacterium pluranimalium]MBM7825198.1 hypothetical protein [Arcanobacterium pluranimalium]
MKKYLGALLGVCVGFSVIMLVLGAITVVRAGFEPASLGVAVFGLAAFALTIFGARTERPMLCAAAALGTGLVVPTSLGIVPMIVGFVIFMLVISLQLYITMFTEK